MPARLLVGADGEQRTTRLLHLGRAVLLDFADDAGARRTAAGWQGRLNVHTVSAKPVDGPDVLAGVPALLLRPDGYVAWAGEPAQGLAAALERWLGAASA
jgi:bifunctional hydroxylase/dehydrase